MSTRYKRAFKCARCPESASEDGCPCWVEFVVQEIASGETKINKMCVFQALPTLLTHVIKASNGPAAAVESTRNEIALGLAKIAAVMPALANGKGPPLKEIENDARGPT